SARPPRRGDAGAQPRRRRLPRPRGQGRHRRGDDPEGGGVPRQPAGRCAEDAHDRRPAAALAPAGDLHRPRCRDGNRARNMTRSHAPAHAHARLWPGWARAGAGAWERAANMTSQQTIDLFSKYVIGNYTRYPVSLVRGEGSYVWDAEGNRYLDF